MPRPLEWAVACSRSLNCPRTWFDSPFRPEVSSFEFRICFEFRYSCFDIALMKPFRLSVRPWALHYMGQIRNPKHEMRNKSETANHKSEVHTCQLVPRPLEWALVLLFSKPVRLDARPGISSFEFRICFVFRYSSFDIRACLTCPASRRPPSIWPAGRPRWAAVRGPVFGIRP